MNTIQDCVLRYPNSIQIHVNIDEFVTTRYFSNLTSAINFKIDLNKDASATIIPSVLFCEELNSNSSGIPILSHSLREIEPWPYYDKSKVIVLRPKCLDVLGIHFVYRNNAKTCSVDTKIILDQDLLIFHFRSCEINDKRIKKRMNELRLKNGYMKDESMKRFSKEVQTFVDQYLD